MSTKAEKLAWRRSKVTELRTIGLSYAEIAQQLQVLDLLTNATVVDDAIRFVASNRSKNNQKSFSKNEDDEQDSKEPHYDEDEDQIEEEQENKTGEVTTNQVF